MRRPKTSIRWTSEIGALGDYPETRRLINDGAGHAERSPLAAFGVGEQVMVLVTNELSDPFDDRLDDKTRQEREDHDPLDIGIPTFMEYCEGVPVGDEHERQRLDIATQRQITRARLFEKCRMMDEEWAEADRKRHGRRFHMVMERVMTSMLYWGVRRGIRQ